MVIKFDAL